MRRILDCQLDSFSFILIALTSAIILAKVAESVELVRIIVLILGLIISLSLLGCYIFVRIKGIK